MAQASDHPVQLSIDYPESSNRLTAFFRLILAIPIIVVSTLLVGLNTNLELEKTTLIVISSPATLFFAVLLMVLFRKKYPRWWFDFNLELRRFLTRVEVYCALMQDAYPSTDEGQSAHVDIEYPENLNRWLPLVKWLLAIPHYIVLAVLGIIAFVLLIVVWFAILITGRYPRAIFDFLVGVGRWGLRVDAYAFMLATDRYPPFRLSP